MFITRIRRHEIGLRFRHGDLARVLTPGTYLTLPRLRLRDTCVVTFDRFRSRFEHPRLDALVREPQLAAHLIVVELADHERAIVWRDGRVGWILGPGLYAFWKNAARIDVERFDVSVSPVFTHPRFESVVNSAAAAAQMRAVRVAPQASGLLFINGRFERVLESGFHAFWNGAEDVKVDTVDLREQALDVAGQEIMTGDKVTLRANLVVTYRVTDPLVAMDRVTDAGQALYRVAQLALREAIGVRTLDELLADKQSLGSALRDELVSRAVDFGVTVERVGLRDLILPGDMKSILNEVILAHKQAEANLIRRREETAAARSQANTARLLAENPVLTRMKELEALQDILAGAKTTFVLGQGDLLGQIRGLADGAE